MNVTCSDGPFPLKCCIVKRDSVPANNTHYEEVRGCREHMSVPMLQRNEVQMQDKKAVRMEAEAAKSMCHATESTRYGGQDSSKHAFKGTLNSMLCTGLAWSHTLPTMPKGDRFTVVENAR